MLLTKIGLYGGRHPAREAVGVGVFLREQDVPGLSELGEPGR